MWLAVNVLPLPCSLVCLTLLLTARAQQPQQQYPYPHHEQPIPIRPPAAGRYDGGARRSPGQPRPPIVSSDEHAAYPQVVGGVPHRGEGAAPHHDISEPGARAYAEPESAAGGEAVAHAEDVAPVEEEFAGQAQEMGMAEEDVGVDEHHAQSQQHPSHEAQPQSHEELPTGQYKLMHNPPHVKPAGPPSEYDLSDEEYRHYHKTMPLFQEGEGSEDDQGWEGDTGRNVLEDWTHLMGDFLPDMFVTFPLPARGEEFFYQDFGSQPTRLRGAFFIAGQDDFNNRTNSVKLRIIDPQGQPIFEHRGGERVFNVVTKQAGTYTVFFSNPAWMGQELRVTAVLGAGNETTLKMENVNSVHENVLVVARMIRDIQAESKYLWSRQKSQMTTVVKAHSGIIWVSISELVAVVLLSAAQIFFLKSLVSHRRIF